MAVEKKPEAKVAWEGDSLEVVRSFPARVRQELGLDIRRLQEGLMPHDSRPMRSGFGGLVSADLFNASGRYALHAFAKKSAKTSRNDLATATARLKAVRARIAEESKNARKNN